MGHTVQIDRNSPMPIFRQVEEQILSGIRNGSLKPGERIPSQYELARVCQVSRATVQKALDRLIREEVLYYQQGKGIFVAAPAERQHLPILQSVSQSLRALGYQVHADLLLIEEIEGSSSVCEALALAPEAAVIHVKRLQYANDEPIMLQETYLDAKRFQSIQDYDLRRESLTTVIQKLGNLYLKGSSIAIGAKEAHWEEGRSLQIQAGTSLLTIEEIDYDEGEQPVRFSRNKLRSDRFRVVMNTLSDHKISLEYRLQPGTVVMALL
jgi:GntR family transcriptional regulator